MKKTSSILIQATFFIFLFVPVISAAPQIDGVMSYTDSNDWGSSSLSKTTTNDFGQYSTQLANVVVEEGDSLGSYRGDDSYDVEEIGLYISDNTLYIGLQTNYDLSKDPNDDGIYAGDFIFRFGNSDADTFSDYNVGNYDFAFDFSVSQSGVDITFLSGNMTGTGTGSSINNYGTDWGITSASTRVQGSNISYKYGFSGSNSGSYDNCYPNGSNTLELSIDLNSLSEELTTLLKNFSDESEYASVAMYWQPSCGNDFLAAKSSFGYSAPASDGSISPTPEPNTMLLFGIGLLWAGVFGRKKQMKY